MSGLMNGKMTLGGWEGKVDQLSGSCSDIVLQEHCYQREADRLYQSNQK